MIESGRTISVKDQLTKWYESEYKNADTSWVWGYNSEALQKILDTREPIPFRCFFVRYLLEIHKEELQTAFAFTDAGENWVNTCAEELLAQIDAGEGQKYKTASEELKLLTDLVYDDFTSNMGFLSEKEGTEKTNFKMWNKNQIFEKITADHINAGDLWTLGFGLNMDCEDISFFLKKALKRTDFNLWNYQELLLYITFRYAQGNCMEFYLKLQKEFKKIKPIACDWSSTDGFSTVFIKDRTELLAEKIQNHYYAFALNEKGELPKEIRRFLGEYKYLIEYTEDYTRTVQKEASRLLTKFKENIKGDIEASKAVLKDEVPEIGKISQGKVIVYYDPEKGLDIPRGTIFYKERRKHRIGTISYRDQEKETEAVGKTAFYGKREEARVAFVVEKDVYVAPEEDALRKVKIPVQCSEQTKKMKKPEDEYGFVPGNTAFTSNNPYLQNIRNISRFKTPTKEKSRVLAVGELTCVAGTLYADCTAGKSIPGGTEFHPNREGLQNLTFVSKEDVSADVYEEIWVYCTEPEEEATLNEITDCSIPNWQSKFERIGNKKIGFNKKKDEDAAKGGVLYNYLYPSFEENYYLKDVLNKEYLPKLEMVLKKTQLSSTKLSQIESKKAGDISRNDILTLSFLEFMSELDEKWNREGFQLTEKDYSNRSLDFIQRTNEVLDKCGFYELYAPNPYDSLLICLLSSSEAIDAYRNLWGWYLANKEETDNA